MPAKKKKSSKKSKKSKEPKPEEEKKPEDEEPEYIDPSKAFPEVEISVILATPPVDFMSKGPTDHSAIDFKETLRTNTRISTIKQMIIDRYDGSIKAEDLSLCLDHYNSKKEHWLDPQKRLCEVGVTAASTNTKIIYDFVPISYPLLNTPLANIVAK